MSPDLRTASLSVVCGAGFWEDPAQDGPIARNLYAWAEGELYKHGQGVHFNEPDYFLKDWKVRQTPPPPTSHDGVPDVYSERGGGA